MMDIDMKVDISEPLKQLALLNSPKVKYRVMVNMKRAIARKIWDELQRTATTGATAFTPGPNPPGLLDSFKDLKDSLKVTRRGNVFVAVGRANPRSPHAHLVEMGHNSSRNGPVEGKGFLAAAGEAQESRALELAAASMRKTMKRYIKKRR